MSKLERIIHDNSNGLDYILVGEIYLPLIAVPEEKREIGFYGSLHRNYLKDYKSGLYSYLTLSGKLWTYLADLNEQCLERRDMSEYMRKNGITDGSCGMRSLIDWINSTEITGDPYRSALCTIISKATSDPEDRETLKTAILEPIFAPKRRKTA